MSEPTTADIRGRFEMDDFGMTEGTLIEVESDDYFQFCGLLLDRLEARDRHNVELATKEHDARMKLEAAEQRAEHACDANDSLMALVQEHETTIKLQQKAVDLLKEILPMFENGRPPDGLISAGADMYPYHKGTLINAAKAALAKADEPKIDSEVSTDGWCDKCLCEICVCWWDEVKS